MVLLILILTIKTLILIRILLNKRKTIFRGYRLSRE
nr:MAG TPA: hypothetical protein [Caudoviricetes sp.]